MRLSIATKPRAIWSQALQSQATQSQATQSQATQSQATQLQATQSQAGQAAASRRRSWNLAAWAFLGAVTLVPSASAQLAWTEEAPSRSPEARFGHTVVQSIPSYQPMLFGGANGTVAFGDTWRWNGSTWIELSKTGPTPRSGHAMHMRHFGDDSMLLFGGETANGTRLADTWIWSGSSWQELQVSPSPSARSGAVLAHDEFEIKTLAMFGGRTNAGLSNETWSFVDGSWSLVPTAISPPAREDHQFIYAPAIQKFVLFGGRDDQGLLADVWEFDGVTWRQVDDLPAASAQVAAVFEGSNRRRLLTFGGESSNLTADTMERLESGVWVTHATVGAPSPRSSSSIGETFESNGASYLLFGGRDGNGAALGDTWTMKPSTKPEVEVTGVGCGPGAWSPVGGPDLFAWPSALLGNTIEVSAYSPNPGRVFFVIGEELPVLPIGGCALQLKPSQITPAMSQQQFPGLAIARMDVAIPFLPVLAGTTLSAQVMVENRTVPGGTSFSKVMRWVLAE